MIATIGFMAVGNTYAQSVPIPDPNWPLDSVVNGAVHLYTVKGDPNYSENSTFVWTVEGGRLFFDQNVTLLAGDGTTATVTGSGFNTTQLYVIWDSFSQPLDTGYVYVSEISADGCVRSDSDPGKFRGMRVKVSAPPKVRFLRDETITCSNLEGIFVDLVIDGMPPFDLKWSYNGEIRNWHINASDLVDSDLDGLVDNVTLFIDDYMNTTVNLVYQLVLLEASSGGVLGEILPNYSTHTVRASVQPDSPIISPTPIEVTAGNQHQYMLSDPGVNVSRYYWELYSIDKTLYYETDTKDPSTPIVFNYPIGEYQLVCYYLSTNGCFSLADTLDITIFDQPAIAFSDSSSNAIGCSALDNEPNDAFEFVVEYYGARSYEFSYGVYDYNNVLLYERLLDFQMSREVTITIPNNFINYELPDVDRDWKVVILGGINEEREVLFVIDGAIVGGRDERTITIHPKPIINEDIDFAN